MHIKFFELSKYMQLCNFVLSKKMQFFKTKLSNSMHIRLTNGYSIYIIMKNVLHTLAGAVSRNQDFLFVWRTFLREDRSKVYCMTPEFTVLHG